MNLSNRPMILADHPRFFSILGLSMTYMCSRTRKIKRNTFFLPECGPEFSMIIIMITCPCNIYPRIPHFYIAKLGYAGVYLFFLFLLQNIDFGYSLEPPRRGGVPTIYILSKNIKNIKIFPVKIFSFTTQKNLNILHGQVFVV